MSIKTPETTTNRRKPRTVMAKAAIAMLDAGAYDCGGDDRWVFAGRHENGCEELVDAGLCLRHPKGLMTYSHTRRTLTSDGSIVGKQMYRLNHSGEAYAKKQKVARMSEPGDARSAADAHESGGTDAGGRAG